MRRSRIIRIKDYIIVTNFKCMFSSINKLDICEKDPKISSKYKKIFLYRDINKRTISCFLNWMISYPIEENILNYDNDCIDNSKFGWLIYLLCKEKKFCLKNYLLLLREDNTIELFKLFLTYLPNIYTENGHTRDQYTIVEKKKINVDTFINIDNKQEVKYLEKLINQKIVNCNKSEKDKKELLLNFIKKNKKYDNIIKEIYKRDIVFLPIYHSL
jgi:hypothetical protein